MNLMNECLINNYLIDECLNNNYLIDECLNNRSMNLQLRPNPTI